MLHLIVYLFIVTILSKKVAIVVTKKDLELWKQRERKNEANKENYV